ncbi:thioesterase family protein [Frankia sp. CNm7]|uniref:Thioesterase family protein n=1 Tax=Frankia nepalensis TaxID=1836974 RepID=A0A937UPB6_9ACTN|nr:hotdog domain-containing protein [Frankia nepalensis]MBL7498368.1 thioesterase family protein [Frankia nepalensis]MBL7513223.1 thioesterase family protein [Frankia nepalensis]MBL7520071.1 thioesterase family protein [Frankia nepalensis]MBL7628907.1 thioesterase family protein [Frankia nepalensis]
MGAGAREFPETRLRVGPLTLDEGMRAPMRVGPWICGPDGEQAVGALGVIVDDAVGVEVHRHRPAGTHSVTTELSLDVVVPPPWTGPELVATARLAGAGPEDGVSRGEVRAGDGRLVAVATGRSRFVPAVGIHAGVAEIEADPPERVPPADHRSILEALGIADLAVALEFDPELAGAALLAHEPADALIPSPRPTGGLAPVPAGIAASASALPARGGRATTYESPARPASSARLTVPPDPALGNGSGTMHGGLLLACSELAATALAGGLRATPAADYTASVRMNLLRPALLDEPVQFTATVVNRGRSLSVYHVISHGRAGRPYTVATVTRARKPA